MNKENYINWTTSKNTDETCEIHQNHYQWVPYVLVGIGILFKAPHAIWKILEEGKMNAIVKGVKMSNKK